MDIVDCNVGEVSCGYCDEQIEVFVLAQHVLEMRQRNRVVRGSARCHVCKRRWEVQVAQACSGLLQLVVLREVDP